jgi:hypothetical protein
MWLCTCLDVILGLLLGTIVNWICYLTATSLFWFIEKIVAPNITVESVFAVLIWFMTPPLLIIRLLLTILPNFYNYKTNYRLKFILKTGSCSSGRHGRRGRHSDRHHTWWSGSSYRNKKDHDNKEDSPRTRYRQQRLLCNKERSIRRKINLLKYFDPLIIPSNMFVIDDDVFYDTDTFDEYFDPVIIPSNMVVFDDRVFYDTTTFDGLLPSLNPNSSPFAISSKMISTMVDSFDVLSHYKQLLHFETASFFNSSYRRLDPSSTKYNTILIQARHLKLQVFHYDTTFDSGSTIPEIYISTNNKELPIVIDTGASSSITPISTDFTTEISKADLQELKQVNGTTAVCGQGTVTWPIEDVDGIRRSITTEAYYVPDAGIRLFSPQDYIRKNTTSNLVCNCDGIRFTLKCGTVLRFPFNKSNNLPFMLTQASLRKQKGSHLLSSVNKSLGVYNSLIDRSIFNRDNFNLNPAQCELLKWHCRWCHCDLNRVRMILSKPRQPKEATKTGISIPQMVVPSVVGTTTCLPFCCEACQYAKQKRKTPDSSIEIKNVELEGVLTAGDLQPGDKVSCDQYMSPSKGRLMHTRGKESNTLQYVGGTIFVDHATNFLFNNHQVNLHAETTVASKHKCESLFDEYGVQTKQYAADNHPFRSKAWVSDCAVQQQLPTKHSGVGAHHQILAERQIQTIFNWSRADLLHFVLHWPQVARNRDDLWPFAVDYAVYMHNHLPNRDSRISPVELFTNTLFSNYNHLTRAHVFGCPVYVLDPRLQDSKSIPKWTMRSRRGIYLGVSKVHSSTVHLILNPETGVISPQYHCVFDDTFSTVWSDGNFDKNLWLNLVEQADSVEKHFSLEPNTDGSTTLPPDFIPFSSDMDKDQAPQQRLSDRDHSFTNNNNNNNNKDVETEPETADNDASSPLISRRIFSPSSTPLPSAPAPSTPIESQPRRSTRSNIGDAPDRLDPSNHLATQYTTTSTAPSEHYCNALGIKLPSTSRGRTTSQGGCSKVFYTHEKQNLPKVKRNQLNSYYNTCLNWSKLLTVCNGITTLDAFKCEIQKNLTYENGYGIQMLEYFNPALLIAIANKDDNPTLKEAMNSPDSAGFMKAMEIEIDTLIRMEAFIVIDKQPWMNVVSSVWAFKRKRYPDGSIRKLKARICARGFEQIEGIDYFETFAPVVQWMTVRIILIMTILLNLENKQIDYTAAFMQAPIDHDVYVEMPKLFQVNGKVWKLKRALYGLKDAPRAYFMHTKGKLEELGFRQSDADPCLFISPTVICLIYVDDALFVYKSPKEVDILTQKMKNLGMLFEEESDVAGYLGVLIDRDPDNDTITLRQSGLAQRIVEALHLDDDTSPTKTPADAFLPQDVDGEHAHELYNYASVAGMLQYLQGHSRPDISFAVSQVSRYTFGPRRSHELAIERIGRYLKGTIDKGLILKPNLKETTFKIDVYVDAAFASGWGTELGSNPDSVKSRTGYIIEVMGCSVIWCSKLQPCIATSTMESEYTALSMALRAAIPLMAVTTSINKGLNFTATKFLQFKATVHEDNMGALKLAHLEPGRNTPRSKFYALKLHWFRSWLKPKEIEIIHCPTKDQKADFLTKPLGPTLFEACRLLSMGW